MATHPPTHARTHAIPRSVFSLLREEPSLAPPAYRSLHPSAISRDVSRDNNQGLTRDGRGRRRGRYNTRVLEHVTFRLIVNIFFFFLFFSPFDSQTSSRNSSLKPLPYFRRVAPAKPFVSPLDHPRRPL